MEMALKLSMILCGALERDRKVDLFGPLLSVYREWSKSEDLG